MGKPKIFCVGCNKTGTTSLKKALEGMGCLVGHQARAEALAREDWPRRDFRRIIRYCRTAQAFQDAPFSLPYTFQAVDAAFPGSRFILTVRDDAEQWYNSLVRFHAKLWSKGRLPLRKEHLQRAFYRYKGRPWEMNRFLFNTPENEPYKKEVLLAYYDRHNASVKEYFRHRPGELLVLNVARPGAYRELCAFLGQEDNGQEFPWENRT